MYKTLDKSAMKRFGESRGAMQSNFASCLSASCTARGVVMGKLANAVKKDSLPIDIKVVRGC